MTDQPDASYPKMPSIQPEEVAATSTGPAPSTVSRAVQLMYANAVLGIIGLFVVIADEDSIRQRLVDSGTVKPADLDAAVTVAIAFSVGVGIVFIVLWIWLAMMVRKGRNWARIVTWILAGLGLLSTVIGLINPPSTLSAVLTAVGGAIDIAVIVLLAMRPSNEFFTRNALRR